MQYLSKEIEALAKKTRSTNKSLVKREVSCGIFQDCGEQPNHDEYDQKIENLLRGK